MFCFYGPFIGIMFSGLCVRLSVRSSVLPSSVHPSVPLQVKVFGQGSFWWSWSPINLKLSTHVPYDMIFLILKLEIFPHFYGPLNIENDSADEASVYYGHVLFVNLILINYGNIKKLSAMRRQDSPFFKVLMLTITGLFKRSKMHQYTPLLCDS